MVFLVGFFGFLCGFALGLLVVNRLLKDRPKNELLTDKALQLRYGLFTWMFAGAGAYCAVWLYNWHF